MKKTKSFDLSEAKERFVRASESGIKQTSLSNIKALCGALFSIPLEDNKYLNQILYSNL